MSRARMAKGDSRFPTMSMRLGLLAYTATMTVGLPFILSYLYWRGTRDRLYSRHMSERFGLHESVFEGSVWVHAVSLGEVRSAVPLITRLLEDAEKVVVTVHTPAGRREVARVFAKAIDERVLRVTYAPLEYRGAWKRFMAAFKPRYGLVMEIEMWPGMITSARALGVPLFMCNAQYPTRSYDRDKKRYPLRLQLVRGFAGVMAKSHHQAERFKALGARQVAVTGEMRFDQEVPGSLIKAGEAARRWLGADRKMVVAFSSVVAGEEGAYIEVMEAVTKGLSATGADKPLFVFVPRAPERFDEIARILSARGLTVAKRSELFGTGLEFKGDAPAFDVLLGNSLGEMHFYMAMSDAVVIGGGFSPKGAHNIIEALSQGKQVFVGPHTWTIEYPMVEALEAKVVKQSETPAEMAKALLSEGEGVDVRRIEEFCRDCGKSVERTLEALPRLLEGARSGKD